ncbi:MAG TPA: diaminobutyrate--2-oxoglutarate transaminase family protein [Jatrophihabitans sp.]|nr:diaminobutyrate--2-oxoglutarate transaminase family protein [Jatrophihabitans sp.]
MPFDLDSVLTPRSLPGPRSAELLERQGRRESNARSYPRRLPFAIDRAEGPYVIDLDGNVFVDFLMGAGVLPLGHSHPELVAAAAEQLPRFAHGLDMPTAIKDEFTELQLAMLPESMRETSKIHFCGPTGANTVDAAIKLAKTATGRGEVISFRGGFHGTTHLGMAVSGLLEQRQPVANTTPGVHFAPYSYCSRCPVGLTRATCSVNCATSTETQLTDENGGVLAPAAVILELVQGEGGVIPADREFVTRVVAAARAAGALVIVDEVQTGCGRTGTWFAFEQYGFEPDIVCTSKALSGIGTPLGLIIYRKEIDVWAPGSHTGTFRGNQIGFATGVRTLKIFQREGVLANVRARGQQVAGIFGQLADVPQVRDVRGLGLMWGIELHDPATGQALPGLAKTVQQVALHHGLIVELGGRGDSVVRILPPLNATEELIEAACTLLVGTIRRCAAEFGTVDRGDITLVGADA